MNQEVEIEFKNVVTKAEFEKLTSYFSIDKNHFITQQNHYFDTLDFSLKAFQSALRIREKNEKAILTLKQPHHVGLLETHQPLLREEVMKAINEGGLPAGEVAEYIESSFQINPNDFCYLGTLTTNRAEMKFEGGTLVFDHSTYLDIEDYEIEYEGTEEKKAKETFFELLNKHKIPTRKTDNKIVRFFKRKGNKL